MKFTFDYIEDQYARIVAGDYKLLNCLDAIALLNSGKNLPKYCLINRVDVDMSVPRARRLGMMFSKLGVPASFFFRLHANEYNPLSFENLAIIRDLDAMGFEIGYHSEIVDGAAIWQEDAADVLRRDLDIMAAMLGKRIEGIASHGGLTGLNNLDFWSDRSAEEFGASYEAYDERIFKAGVYVSDSEWTRWKSYRKGHRIENSMTSPAEYVELREEQIYLLVHSDTYFDRHIYES
jgi:hypothetical protein